jgi:phosphoribosylanthranilate isomerase
MLKPLRAAPDDSSPGKPWFLAGGIGLDNIAAAMALGPFAVDVSSGAETNGVKDREKILRLTAMARKAEA